MFLLTCKHILTLSSPVIPLVVLNNSRTYRPHTTPPESPTTPTSLLPTLFSLSFPLSSFFPDVSLYLSYKIHKYISIYTYELSSVLIP